MSLETKVTLRRYSDGKELPPVDDSFIRRDFDAWDERDMVLSTTKTEVVTTLSSIEFIYVRRTGDEATVSIFKSLSPESWDFDNTFMAFVASGCTSISLKASVDTVVHLYMAGS